MFFFVTQFLETSLHISAFSGHEDVVKLLLQQSNIVIDARDEVRVHYGTCNISIVS